MTIHYTSNPDLATVKRDWPGTPITSKGRYINHEHPFVPQVLDIIRWKSQRNPYAAAKKADQWRLQVNEIPHLKDLPPNSITWLGHATFCIKLGGYTIVTDPIYQSPTLFMPRYAPFPLEPSGLSDTDLLLISHDHRDHTDRKSLRRFFQYSSKATVFTGLGMGPLLSKPANSTNTIVEAGWWQQYPHPDLEIVFLPTRHWSKRSLFDTNRRLWGSFYISDGTRRVYFGGDSGFGSHYEEINDHFGGIDCAILGIGAYEPEWFMHPSHTSPKDAYRAATLLQARLMIPMHYGTFDLSDETISKPYTRIKAVASPSDHTPILRAVMPGEPVLLD